MKAIMISDHPKWCALMMNGDKTIEVRAGTALYKAIQKLIDEYGYADIFVHCSKIQRKHYHLIEVIDIDTGKTEYEVDYYIGSGDYLDYCYDGKVAFKFRCYKVEEIKAIQHWDMNTPFYWTKTLNNNLRLQKASCLFDTEIYMYLGSKQGYAIHISDLEIFDKPKELSEFKIKKKHTRLGTKFDRTYETIEPLTKAPQHFCYVEVE